MEQQTYSPEEFLESLVNNNFPQVNHELRKPLTLTGMVKHIENNGTELLFKVGSKCDDLNWRTIPLSMIDNIALLESESAETLEAYPLVKITFKVPESEEAFLFMSFITDALDDAKHVVLKLLDTPNFSEFIERSDCSQCFRECRVSKPEDFFHCLKKCAPLCPTVVEEDE